MAATDQEGGQREAILDAAFGRFAHYGYRRTSLGDIAEAAGLSRPALYHYFHNKEDVFRALAQRINRGVVEAVTAAAQREGDTLARLTAVVEARVGWAFDLLHASEHGRELIDEKNRLCGAAGADTNAEFAALLERILARGEARGEISLASVAMSPREAALFLIDSVEGVIGKETVEAAARHRLRILTQLFVGGLRVPAG
ncbi:AcrR family transcriptional regulator [Caulobacter ginsengisoli]|uniref:AcrR family transcriptional regulator n=1 Tax=Caulobacter ginsengisoli TaxID=400775 RepID=A0ABU0IX75_9CAUL|nr:helix-turn-helix domain-containing protein [Caulobacter ginsengisoli]MDQ0465557.1 AcrR family transcriptional regulator [Caulobacter ginsengisoli]